jgi:hypothetical protein
MSWQGEAHHDGQLQNALGLIDLSSLRRPEVRLHIFPFILLSGLVRGRATETND